MINRLIIISVTLVFSLTAGAQNLFLVDENSYPCTETIILQANSIDDGNLSISFAKEGERGLLAVSAESSFGAIFSEKLIIYLEDGTVITCKNMGPYDYVDSRAKAVYYLTSDQLNELKNSNIHTVRYTLKAPSDDNILLNLEWNSSASNKGTPTKTIITDFFDHGISKKDRDYDDQSLEEEAQIMTETSRNNIFNRTRNALNYSNSAGTGTGNQGAVTGSTKSNVYSEGSGTGSRGISFNLAGRTPTKLPSPTYDIQSEGIVVVEITVDRNGNVTNAEPGVKGSTTLEDYFLRVSKEAALSANFDAKPDAPLFQKGTITYHFNLR